MIEEEQPNWASRFHGTVVAELLNLCPEPGPCLTFSLLEDPPSALGYSVGVCTHPNAADDLYMHSRGGKKLITDASVPSGFRWIGTLDRGATEYFFAMWREGDRWFWFYHAHVFFLNPDADWPSYDLVRERFASALDRWNSGQRAVIYSQCWGWYDPDTGRFESDPYVYEREEWDPPRSAD
jgi:hypothetical protein